ncbi:MAG: ATP synthase F1 subunit gamma, partial [Solirubrobacteraceae bacterium]
AEQRIAALRPYADALRRMTRQAALDAGAEASRLELLNERETIATVGLLLVTGDRGLAGGFNSQVIRAGVRAGAEADEEGLRTVWYATGRRGVSSLTFRGREVSGAYTGFTDKPSYADAREIARELIEAYTTGAVDRVELVYNSYVSPLTQEVTRETLLPLSSATIAGEEERDGEGESGGVPGSGTAGSAGTSAGTGSHKPGPRALVEYEPDAEEILRRLVPDYVETSIYRALVESAAGFFGAQMTAMRNASENAGEIITDLTLEMNRARQAEITQEIMEVVAGAEGLT